MTATRDYIGEILSCPLCLDVLFEPIATMCGHTFCRVCLGESLKRLKKACPVCRAPCMLDVAKTKENSMISQMVKDLFPSEVARKKKEMVAVSTDAPLCLYSAMQEKPSQESP